MTRRYTLRQRATRQAETRQRILDAAVALHGSIGPARTTISAVAARAGVQRLTVYHHFGDEGALFAACSGQWAAQNPPPDATIWARIAEPALRLRTALTALFAYWRRVEAMMVNILRDRTLAPALQAAAADAAVYWSGVRVLLATGWGEEAERRPLLMAAIGHALDFQTWRSLTVEQGLNDAQAVGLMLGLVRMAAGEAGG